MRLPLPTPDVARCALAGVSSTEALVAFCLDTQGNAVRVDLLCLADVGEHLAGPKWCHLTRVAELLPYTGWVDVHRLADWIETVIGDESLAWALRDITQEAPKSYRAQVSGVVPLLAVRYAQYQEVAGLALTSVVVDGS